MPFGLFIKKRPFFPGRYKVEAGVYKDEYRLFKYQPAFVQRQLKAIKIIMAVFIPVFFVLSVFSTKLAIATGCLTCIPLFFIFYKVKKNVKTAVAFPVSILIGVVFGFWFRYQLGVFQ
jgi:hypothetical protein